VEQGLNVIKETTPSIAILDYNLGQETSMPIARALHQANVPFLFLSGQIERVVTDSNLPARRVIPKPFIPSHLVRAVNALKNGNRV